MNRDYTKSYLVFCADLGFLESAARKYKKGALALKNDDYSSCTPSFHLLSSLVFELFPKILIGYDVCVKYKADEQVSEETIREEISNEMKKYNHHLERLYKKFPDMLKDLNIKDIVEFKNGNVWEYRVKIDNKEILIKDIESIRYGSFAKNRDIMTYCIDDNIIVDLLNKLEQYIENKSKEVFKILNVISE